MTKIQLIEALGKYPDDTTIEVTVSKHDIEKTLTLDPDGKNQLYFLEINDDHSFEADSPSVSFLTSSIAAVVD